MSERPLNERPALRPKINPSQSAQAPVTYDRPWYSELGLVGTTIVVVIGLTFGGLGMGLVFSQLEGPDSGREVYDVQPAVPDPRSSYPISAECDAAMAASAAEPLEEGERLLKETGNICKSQEEWEAALYKYPGAIGGTSTAYLDGSEFDLLCGSYPEVKLCRKKD